MTEKNGKPPKLTGFQRRVSANTAFNALRKGKDTLIVAPTGAGKTSIFSRVAKLAHNEGKRVLILNEREIMQEQNIGAVEFWTGIRPGRISSEGRGGMDTEPGIVVGMVETTARNLEKVGRYDVIVIDETQHASAESDDRDVKGAYARIIAANPDAKLVACTALDERGDGDELHPRISKAEREVVSVEEAREEGRIRKVRTYEGRARLENGRTSAEMARDELDGKLDGRTASSDVRKLRGETFYSDVTEDWERLCERKQTIMFVDSVREVDEMTERLERRYGRGTAVGIHGSKKATNDEAVKAYSEGRAGILVSCKMIGEGFDVPETSVVMSVNASLSRQEMNQYAGRCARTSPGEEEGMFVDYGTASVMHGKIEHQHDLQNVDAFAAARSRIGSARAVGMAAPVSRGDWSLVPGGRKTLVIRRNGSRYGIYEIDHKAQREMGRRPKDDVSRLTRARDEKGKPISVDIGRLGLLVADHVRRENGFFARNGGVGGKGHEAKCKEMMEHWKGTFDQFDRLEKRTTASEARREHVEWEMAGKGTLGKGSAVVREVLLKAKDPDSMVRESLDLAGAVLGICSRRETIPIGRRGEAESLARELGPDILKGMSSKELTREARQMQRFFRTVSRESDDPTVSKVLEDLGKPMETGAMLMERKARAARKAAQR